MSLRFIQGFMLLAFFCSCTEEEYSNIKPSLSINSNIEFVSSDTVLGAGELYKIGISASSENGENITNLIVKSNGKTMFDKGYNTSFLTETINLTKSLEAVEILTIIVRNKARLADSIQIVISKANKDFGEILRYEHVLLGAQENPSDGNYYSISENQVYFQNQAFNNQGIIDLVYFFDAGGDGNTLASPGANVTGILSGFDSPDYWANRRTTYYTRSSLNIDNELFNNALNDSLIVSNLFADGGRKAKLLSAGKYFGFVTQENKFGLIKIEEVIGQQTGTITFSLIIQK